MRPWPVSGWTQVHVTTLDEVVSVNSFFTVAVFIGMAFTRDNSTTNSFFLDDHPSCKPGPNTIRLLMVFEVVSFSCFLFSTLVAHGMKLFIVFSNSKGRAGSSLGEPGTEDSNSILSATINNRFLRTGMLACAGGTVAGTLLLMLSMVNIIQLRLGRVQCVDSWANWAAIPLILLVSTGLSIFISSAFYAFLH